MGDVTVWLHVPADVPALYLDADRGSDQPGTLLPARGLRWQVARLADVGERLLVTGRVVSPAQTHQNGQRDIE